MEFLNHMMFTEGFVPWCQ